jgi:hypothetical protein
LCTMVMHAVHQARICAPGLIGTAEDAEQPGDGAGGTDSSQGGSDANRAEQGIGR